MAIKPINEELHKQALKFAADEAYKKVQELGLPSTITLSGDVPHLGEMARRTVRRMAQSAEIRWGGRASAFIAFTLKMYWFACWEGASYVAESVRLGEMLDNDYTRELSTADGYAKLEGKEYTLFNKISEIDIEDVVVPLLEGTPLQGTVPDAKDFLEAIAYYWFHEANREMECGNVAAAMDFLCEAYEAVRDEHGIFIYENATDDGATGLPSVRTAAAQMARMRHAENYSLIEYAIKHWRENIDPSISAAKAANELVRVVNLSHKKLAEVISAEKKKLS